MTIHVCDRCGKILSRKEHESQHMQIRHLNDKNAAFQWDHTWRDLCQKCSDELEAWLKVGDSTASQ